MKAKFLKVTPEYVEFVPEGWTNGIRVRQVGYCGQANPGISFHIYDHDRWLGGALTIQQAEALRDHLELVIQRCKDAPPHESYSH